MRTLKKIIFSMLIFLTISLYLCDVLLAQQKPFYPDPDITKHSPEIQMTPEISLPNETGEIKDKWPWLVGGLLLVLAGVIAASGGGGGEDSSDITVSW